MTAPPDRADATPISPPAVPQMALVASRSLRQLDRSHKNNLTSIKDARKVISRGKRVQRDSLFPRLFKTLYLLSQDNNISPILAETLFVVSQLQLVAAIAGHFDPTPGTPMAYLTATLAFPSSKRLFLSSSLVELVCLVLAASYLLALVIFFALSVRTSAVLPLKFLRTLTIYMTTILLLPFVHIFSISLQNATSALETLFSFAFLVLLLVMGPFLSLTFFDSNPFSSRRTARYTGTPAFFFFIVKALLVFSSYVPDSVNASFVRVGLLAVTLAYFSYLAAIQPYHAQFNNTLEICLAALFVALALTACCLPLFPTGVTGVFFVALLIAAFLIAAYFASRRLQHVCEQFLTRPDSIHTARHLEFALRALRDSGQPDDVVAVRGAALINQVILARVRVATEHQQQAHRAAEGPAAADPALYACGAAHHLFASDDEASLVEAAELLEAGVRVAHSLRHFNAGFLLFRYGAALQQQNTSLMDFLEQREAKDGITKLSARLNKTLQLLWATVDGDATDQARLLSIAGHLVTQEQQLDSRFRAYKLRYRDRALDALYYALHSYLAGEDDATDATKRVSSRRSVRSAVGRSRRYARSSRGAAELPDNVWGGDAGMAPPPENKWAPSPQMARYHLLVAALFLAGPTVLALAVFASIPFALPSAYDPAVAATDLLDSLLREQYVPGAAGAFFGVSAAPTCDTGLLGDVLCYRAELQAFKVDFDTADAADDAPSLGHALMAVSEGICDATEASSVADAALVVLSLSLVGVFGLMVLLCVRIVRKLLSQRHTAIMLFKRLKPEEVSVERRRVLDSLDEAFEAAITALASARSVMSESSDPESSHLMPPSPLAGEAELHALHEIDEDAEREAEQELSASFGGSSSHDLDTQRDCGARLLPSHRRSSSPSHSGSEHESVDAFQTADEAGAVVLSVAGGLELLLDPPTEPERAFIDVDVPAGEIPPLQSQVAPSAVADVPDDPDASGPDESDANDADAEADAETSLNEIHFRSLSLYARHLLPFCLVLGAAVLGALSFAAFELLHHQNTIIPRGDFLCLSLQLRSYVQTAAFLSTRATSGASASLAGCTDFECADDAASLWAMSVYDALGAAQDKLTEQLASVESFRLSSSAEDLIVDGDAGCLAREADCAVATLLRFDSDPAAAAAVGALSTLGALFDSELSVILAAAGAWPLAAADAGLIQDLARFDFGGGALQLSTEAGADLSVRFMIGSVVVIVGFVLDIAACVAIVLYWLPAHVTAVSHEEYACRRLLRLLPASARAADFVTWSPEWATGVHSIDAQHYRLFLLINRLYKNIVGSSTAKDDQASAERIKNELDHTLRELSSYAQVHFEFEEQVLQFGGMIYENIEEHKKRHRSYVASIKRFHAEWLRGNASLDFALLSWLWQWLVQHISQEDFAYLPHVMRMTQEFPNWRDELAEPVSDKLPSRRQ
jgi:hemerythrin-like metal-binding protein